MATEAQVKVGNPANKALFGFSAATQLASSISSGLIQGMTYDTAAKKAEVDGEATNLRLQDNYNAVTQNNLIKSAAQGGGTENLEAIDNKNRSQLLWDTDYNNLNTDIKTKGFEEAGKQARRGGVVSGVFNVGTQGLKKSLIGG